MKLSILPLIALLLIQFELQAQQTSKIKTKYYDKLEHIKIDKIVYYETPYTTLCNKPQEEYQPSWYWGYCAVSYPLAFENYTDDAKFYMTSDLQLSKDELIAYENEFKNIKPEGFKAPYMYYFGEIYFTDKKTTKEYLMTLAYRLDKPIEQVDFSKIDTLKFKIPWDKRKKDLSGKAKDVEVLFVLPTTSKYFSLEDGVYKGGSTINIRTNILERGDKDLYFEGGRLDKFHIMLRRAPNFVRSKIVNGERIFETVKYTPNGMVVIGKDKNSSN